MHYRRIWAAKVKRLSTPYDGTLLELGGPAIRYLTELVHRRPRGWWVDVDRLHNILQSHGPEILREALEEGLQEQRFDVSFVEQNLQGKLHFCEVTP